jgi:hypothetical protein
MNIDILGFTEPCGKDDHVRNEVLQRVKEDKNILQTTKRRKTKRIIYVLRKKCFLKHFIGRKI